MAGAVFGNASNGAVTVTASATVITDPSTTTKPLGNRTNIVIYNNDPSATLYLGFGSAASGVTTGTGFPVPPGSNFEADYGPQIVIYGISTSSISVRIVEAY